MLTHNHLFHSDRNALASTLVSYLVISPKKCDPVDYFLRQAQELKQVQFEITNIYSIWKKKTKKS